MYREILTKAIIAKGKRKIIDTLKINTNNNISKVLGCWIINHKYEVYLNDQKTFIKGFYEAFLWYGHDNNSKCDLLKHTFEFNDEIPYNFTLEKSNLSNKNELLVYELLNPSASSMKYDNQELIVDVEREYEVDIIGETKIKIKVDEVIIDEIINTNYVNDNKQQSNK